MSEADSHCDIRQLVEEHYEMLFRFAWRLSGSREDAEDLTQQTYLIAQRKLHQLQDPAAVRSWLCTILRHHFLRSVDHSSVTLEAVPEPDDTHTTPDDFDSEGLQSALNELPEEFRTTLVLFYFGDLSYKEIAQQLDVPLGTVMSRLARGREQLKQKLIAHGITEPSL
jgi:RNA polymerase sigma-70 factor (ECF subfamily)